MRPLLSSRNPGLQMHLKLPSSLMHSPLRHMFLIRHSSWSGDSTGHLSDGEMQFKLTLHWMNRSLAQLICFLLRCCHLTSTAHWQELGAFKDTYTLRNWYFAAKPLLGKLSENVGRTCCFQAENSFILDLWAWTENRDGRRTLDQLLAYQKRPHSLIQHE